MPGPLDGIRVIDLTRILAGPFSTMLMADLGADVIKVEQPETGDPARGNGPFLTPEGAETDEQAFSTYFMSINRGKRSIAIDLANPKGREVLLRLAETADVLIENFRPGTMQRLGLEYETVRARNPRIVMCSVSGFGQTGPYAQRPALDVIVQGMGGMLSITGEPGRGPGAARREHRRHHGGALRDGGHPERAAGARALRRGAVHRHLDARLPGVDHGERVHALLHAGAGAASASARATRVRRRSRRSRRRTATWWSPSWAAGPTSGRSSAPR